MSRSRKFIYLSLTGVLLIAALLGAALYVSSDALLNSPWVHQRVTVALSRATGGAVAYDRLRLVWMPVPRAEFGGVSVSFDGSTIRVDRVTVEPALRLLLHGELRIRGIRLQQPRLNIVLPEGESPFDPRKIESTLRPVFRTLSAIAPDLQMEIRGGFINLVNFWKTPQTRDYRAAFDGLEATLSLSRTMTVNARCASSPWGALVLRGTFDYRPGQLTTELAEAHAGRNSLRNFSGCLDWTKSVIRLAMKTGSGVLSIDDLETWSGCWLGRTVPHLKRIAGQVLLSSAGMDGPLLAPSEWHYALAGDLKKVTVETDPQPAPFFIDRASFQADQTVLSFRDAGVSVLDSALLLTGRLRIAQKSLDDLHASGTIGRKTVAWLARYAPVLKDAVLPGDIRLAGRFLIQPGILQVTHLNLTTGRSFLTGLSGQLDWAGSLHLRADVQRAVIVREEFGLWGAWLLRRVIPELTSISGIFRFDSAHLEGLLERPAEWRYRTSGTVEKAAVGIRSLPAPVRVDSAQFHVDSGRIAFRDVRADFLDAAMAGAGDLQFEGDTLKNSDILFSGQIGEKAARWSADIINPPKGVVIPHGFSVSGGRWTWQGPNTYRLQGIFDIRSGPQLTIDLERTPGALKLHDSAIRDDLSRATISLSYREKGDVTFACAGTLHKKTMDALYVLNQPEEAMLAGKLEGKIPVEEPHAMTVTGAIQARNLLIPLGIHAPLAVRALGLKANGRELTVEPSELTWLGYPIALRGIAKASAEKMHIDADIKTERIVLKDLLEALSTQGENGGTQKLPWLSRLAVEGRIRVGADSFVFHERNFEPFNAELVFGKNLFRIFVTDARHCTLPVAGTVEIFRKGLTFAFQSRVENLKAALVLGCLTGERTGVTGMLSHRLEIEGDQEAPASLRGDGELTLRNGRIYRFSVLSKVLEFLNVTQIVMGDSPDLWRKGTLYDTIRIHYRLEGEELLLDEIQLDGPTLRIAGEGAIHTTHKTMRLTLLVSPLRTVDKVLGKIPIVKDLRNIITIPVGVSGSLNDPTIIPLAPSAIGTHLYELMKSVVRLPFTLWTP